MNNNQRGNILDGFFNAAQEYAAPSTPVSVTPPAPAAPQPAFVASNQVPPAAKAARRTAAPKTEEFLRTTLYVSTKMNDDLDLLHIRLHQGRSLLMRKAISSLLYNSYHCSNCMMEVLLPEADVGSYSCPACHGMLLHDDYNLG